MSEREVALPELLERIEAHRAIVDRRITLPARWRGPLRKPSSFIRTRRVARAFDSLVRRARSGDLAPMTSAHLRATHGLATGGGAYRTSGATMGAYLFPHSVASIPGAVERALARAGDGTEPAPIAAARLHLEVLLIHPFPDGNGRSARLAATWVLLRAGFRSTLLTAVEQHVRVDPWHYIRAFNRIVLGGMDTHWPFIRMSLAHMAASAEHAAAFRRRELMMRELLDEAGILGRDQERVLLDHDVGGRVAPTLSDVPPLAAFLADRPGASRQIRRLLQEERRP